MTAKHPKAKRKPTTFERKAPPMPALQRAAVRPAVEPAKPAGAADAAVENVVPGFLSQKEVLLRLVETLKAL